MHLNGGSTDFVSEDIKGLSDALHSVLRDGSLIASSGCLVASDCSLNWGLLLLLGLLSSSSSSSSLLSGGLAAVILTIVVATKGE